MATTTEQVASGLTTIDTMMAGRTRVTSAYLLGGDEPALVETGPTTSVQAVKDGLEQLGMGADDLAHIVVTHIHLDHSGGVGRLIRSFPRATVWVHQRGARHLADPTRLVASAEQVYGTERLARLFGPVDPVPADRIRAVSDGDAIRLGARSLDVVYTPGHASHHVALVDSGTGAVFTGDALGIHLAGSGVLRPATPPPDIDVEAGVESIERIRERAAGSLLMFSHYGPVSRVDDLCDLASGRLRRWAGIVRDAMDETDDIERIAGILEARTRGEFDGSPDPEGDRDRCEVLSDARMNAAGLIRYWNKRQERPTEAG